MLITSLSTATINARSRTFWAFLLWTKHILITDKSNKTDNYTLPNTFTFSSLEFWGLFQLVCFFFRFRTYLSSNLKTFIALSWRFCCKVKCVQYIAEFLWLLVVTCMQVFYKNEIIVGGLLAWFRVISPKRTFVSEFDNNAPRSLRGAITLTNSWLWKKGLQSTDIFFNLLKAKPEKNGR